MVELWANQTINDLLAILELYQCVLDTDMNGVETIIAMLRYKHHCAIKDGPFNEYERIC